MDEKTLNTTLVEFIAHLAQQEYSPNSIRAYHGNVAALLAFLDDTGAALSKEALILYKQRLTGAAKPSTVNRNIAAINQFLKFAGHAELLLKSLCLQEPLMDEHPLSPREFSRLMDAALRLGRYKIAMIMLTLAQTGIRIGELRFITVEAVRDAKAIIHHKNKIRMIFIPADLQRHLTGYCKKTGLLAGAIFTGTTDAPISRSYVAGEMKALAQSCGVDPAKAFPHNLRHYFARQFLDCGNTLTDLADLLGHSKMETTRRYLRASDETRRRQLEKTKILQAPLLACAF